MTLMNTDVWSGKLFINGWQDSATQTTVTEPATGADLGDVGLATVADVSEAARHAADAQRGWAARKPEERAAVLRRAGELWEQHGAEIGEWIQRESGSFAVKAGLEIHTAANECFEAAALPSLPKGQWLSTNEERWSLSRAVPVGVVGVISPFNFPLILAIRAVAPALALGNAVLLKPDPRTTVCGGVSIIRIFEEAGLPRGLLHLLPGGADIGSAIIEAPEVRVVAFTGSTEAGRAVGELAARHLTRAHLELGGNNALIVLPGADVDLAASAGAFGSFLHQGQICMTAGKHLVHASLYDAYVEALAEKARRLPVGDPFAAGAVIGPIIDEKQLNRIQRIVDDSVSAGAEIVAGGRTDGPFYLPTVITNVSPDHSVWGEEIFGPVAPVISFSTIDEAVALANDGDYGLAVSILGDVGMAMTVADRLTTGMIRINEQTVTDEAQAPFGGTGWSGNGSRIGGAEANIESFTERQWVTLRPSIAPYPF